VLMSARGNALLKLPARSWFAPCVVRRIRTGRIEWNKSDIKCIAGDGEKRVRWPIEPARES